jgi:aminopeptidase-like protein
MKRLVEDLYPLNRVFCSDGYDAAVAYLRDLLPFREWRFSAADEHNGWIIPPKWDVVEARILRDGHVIFDGLEHPLRVIALSTPFHGFVSREELREHLFFDSRDPQATPYHFRQSYRCWDRTWGFCVSQDFFNQLQPGQFEVVIETKESPGCLKVLECVHHGRRPETIALVAHLDHPGVANDDLAGCAVGVELFRWLRGKSTKMTYKLVIVQEIIGSEYYLGPGIGEERKNIFQSLFLEMLGSETPLALQSSMKGESLIEQILVEILAERRIPLRTGPFQSIIANDEFIWEAYGIPMASLSRFPYPEYHCDKDNPSIISEKRLDEAFEILQTCVDRMERETWVMKKFSGTMCLSNPRYNLHVNASQPAFGAHPSENEQCFRTLMDLIPTISQPVTVRALASRVGLPEDEVKAYLKKWVECGIMDLV